MYLSALVQPVTAARGHEAADWVPQYLFSFVSEPVPSTLSHPEPLRLLQPAAPVK